MNDTPRMNHAANESISAVYELGCQLERELADVTKQRDELALCAIELASYANESLPQNQPEFLEGLFERVKKYGDAHFRVYGTYETPKGGEL